MARFSVILHLACFCFVLFLKSEMEKIKYLKATKLKMDSGIPHHWRVLKSEQQKLKWCYQNWGWGFLQPRALGSYQKSWLLDLLQLSWGQVPKVKTWFFFTPWDSPHWEFWELPDSSWNGGQEFGRSPSKSSLNIIFRFLERRQNNYNEIYFTKG